MNVIKRQTIIGSIWSYAGVLIGTITQAFLIPNYFTESQNGLIQVLLSWMLIWALFADFGFGAAGTKFFPTFRSKQEKHRGFLFVGFSTVTIGLLCTIAFLFFFQKAITNTFNTTDNNLFKDHYFLLIPIIAATSYFNLLSNYARGLYDTIYGNFLSQFLQRFFVLISVVVYILEWVSFPQFMILWTLSIFSQFPLMLIHCYQLGDFSLKPFRGIFTRKFQKKFYTYAVFSILTSMSSIVISRLDTLMVYEYLGLANTGIYGTSLLFGSVMMMSFNVSLKASTSIVVDALKENDKPKIERIFKKSALTQLIFGIGLFNLVVCNIDLLYSFLKPSYSAGKWVLIIVGLAKLLDLAFGINSLILVFSKHYIKDSILVVGFVGLLYGLNHLLIPSYGLNGAAVAAFIATLFFNISRHFLILKYFKIHSFSTNQLYALLIGLVVFAVGYYLPDFTESIWLRLFSLSYKSIIIGLLLAFLFRVSNISPDVSGVIDDLLEKAKLKAS